MQAKAFRLSRMKTSLPERGLKGAIMRQQTTRELYSYWNSIRRERAAPDRAEIDPAAIRAILSDTFMIEVDGDGAFPLRLSGARLNALWLKEMKGRSFLDLWGEDRANVAAILWTVMDGAVPVVAGVSAAPPERRPIDLELLLLPLRHHGRTHARILGALACATQPDWFGLIPVERFELRSLRVMSASDSRVDLPVVRRMSGLPERRLGTRPRLRLLSGGLDRSHVQGSR